MGTTMFTTSPIFLPSNPCPIGLMSEDLVGVVIFFAGANEVKGLDVISIQILDFDHGAEDDDVGRQGALVDNDGLAQLILEFVDAGLQMSLVLARGMVLRVFAQVPHLTRRRNPLGDLDHLEVFHAVEVAFFLS